MRAHVNDVPNLSFVFLRVVVGFLLCACLVRLYAPILDNGYYDGDGGLG